MEKEIWHRLDKKDEYEYYIHRKASTVKKIDLKSIKMKIVSIEEPKEFVDVIAVKDGELVGFLEVGILDNGTATMTMQTQLFQIGLPEGISDSKEHLDNHNGAIFVDESQRKSGIAKNMISISIKELKRDNVKKLIVHDVKEEARDFYLKTGAKFSDKKEAEYDLSGMEIE